MKYYLAYMQIYAWPTWPKHWQSYNEQRNIFHSNQSKNMVKKGEILKYKLVKIQILKIQV